MPWISSDLEALEAAIKSGVREVQYRDRRVTYHSLDEMLKLRQLMREEVAGGTELGNVRTTLASFTKG
jgi:thiamine monophosphate synthase